VANFAGIRTECLPYARIEADCLVGLRRADTSSFMENRRFEKHFKLMVEQNQDGINSAAVPWSIEELSTKDEGIDSFFQKKFGFLFHG
jgi:hypothetical protein